MLHLLFVCSLLVPIPQNPATPAPAAPAEPAAKNHYQVEKTFAIGEDGGWDYVTVDHAANRLYVPRGNRVLVLDAETGKKVGELKDTAGVHGVILATGFGKGFSSNGRANNATVFDLKTLAVEKTIATGTNPDALLFEPKRGRVYIGNGRSNDVTVIDVAKLEVLGTIAVGGKPEAMVCDADGTVYVNVEDKSEIVRLDAEKLTADQHWSLAPGEEPTGLAIDVANHTLFAACSNETMVVLDAKTGKVLATPKIGKRTDGAMFDAVAGYAISANGEGTLSIVSTRGEHPFTVIETIATAAGARTLTLDPVSRRLYLPTAEYEAAQPAASGGERRRPAMKAGSFKIVVVGPMAETAK